MIRDPHSALDHLMEHGDLDDYAGGNWVLAGVLFCSIVAVIGAAVIGSQL